MKRFIADKKTRNRAITTAASILFWIGLWWFASILVKKEVVIPSPAVVFNRLSANIITAEFWLVTAVSLSRIAAGYCLAIIIGHITAFTAFFSKTVYTLFTPLISVLRAVPVASYIILLYLMLSTGLIPVVTAFLIVLPIVWENTITGLRNADKNLLEVCQIYHITGFRRLRYFYLPTLKPYISATEIGRAHV